MVAHIIENIILQVQGEKVEKFQWIELFLTNADFYTVDTKKKEGALIVMKLKLLTI